VMAMSMMAAPTVEMQPTTGGGGAKGWWWFKLLERE
jgi:hypothetical protein